MSSEHVPADGPRLHRLLTWFDPESAAVSSTPREAGRINILRPVCLNAVFFTCLVSAGGHHTAGALPGVAVSPAGLH